MLGGIWLYALNASASLLKINSLFIHIKYVNRIRGYYFWRIRKQKGTYKNTE